MVQLRSETLVYLSCIHCLPFPWSGLLIDNNGFYGCHFLYKWFVGPQFFQILNKISSIQKLFHITNENLRQKILVLFQGLISRIFWKNRSYLSLFLTSHLKII